MEGKTVQRVAAVWHGGKSVEGTAESGKKVLMSDDLKPTDLVLMAAAGCSGLTFLAVAREKGFRIRRLSVEAVGERATSEPRSFQQISLKFAVGGEGLALAEVEEALRVAHQRCPVLQSLDKGVKVSIRCELTAG